MNIEKHDSFRYGGKIINKERWKIKINGIRK